MEKPFPAYQGEEDYYFVCYSHEDAASVYPELLRMRELAANIWYDEGINPGNEWTEELASAIRGASALLFFVSAGSVRSKHCRDEIAYALENQIKVVCIYLEPAVLSEGLKLSLSSTQAIMAHELAPDSYELKLKQLFTSSDTAAELSSLSHTAARSPPTPAKRRAVAWASAIVTATVLVAVITLNLGGIREFFSGNATPGPITSIAVLPLKNVSGDPEQDFLADSLTEALTAELGQIKALKVISRTSALQYKTTDKLMPEIARELEVDALLEGSVLRAGNEVRITLRGTRDIPAAIFTLPRSPRVAWLSEAPYFFARNWIFSLQQP